MIPVFWCLKNVYKVGYNIAGGEIFALLILLLLI